MEDQQLIKDAISGLEGALKALVDKKDIFIKANGLLEESEKLRASAEKIRSEITTEKENLKALVEKKNKALQSVTASIAAKMNDVLPAGKAVIEIKDDGSVFIGWDNGKVVVPYSGLSGGDPCATGYDPGCEWFPVAFFFGKSIYSG